MQIMMITNDSNFAYNLRREALQALVQVHQDTLQM